MKQIYGEHYIIKSLRDDYGLGTAYETIEGARRIIDNSNELAVRQGYPAHQYVICKQSVHKVREDCGEFIMSTIITIIAEKYPAELEAKNEV